MDGLQDGVAVRDLVGCRWLGVHLVFPHAQLAELLNRGAERSGLLQDRVCCLLRCEASRYRECGYLPGHIAGVTSITVRQCLRLPRHVLLIKPGEPAVDCGRRVINHPSSIGMQSGNIWLRHRARFRLPVAVWRDFWYWLKLIQIIKIMIYKITFQSYFTFFGVYPNHIFVTD